MIIDCYNEGGRYPAMIVPIDKQWSDCLWKTSIPCWGIRYGIESIPYHTTI